MEGGLATLLIAIHQHVHRDKRQHDHDGQARIVSVCAVVLTVFVVLHVEPAGAMFVLRLWTPRAGRGVRVADLPCPIRTLHEHEGLEAA